MRTRTTEPKRRPHAIAVDMTDLHQYTAHNYSIQTLNSTELAKEKLREVLARVCMYYYVLARVLETFRFKDENDYEYEI